MKILEVQYFHYSINLPNDNLMELLLIDVLKDHSKNITAVIHFDMHRTKSCSKNFDFAAISNLITKAMTEL